MKQITYSSFIHSPLEKALGDLVRKIVAEELKKAQLTAHYTIHTGEGVTPEQFQKQVQEALKAAHPQIVPSTSPDAPSPSPRPHRGVGGSNL